MLAATTTETIVAIIGMLVPLLIAILQTLKKDQTARVVNSLWEALKDASLFANTSPDPELQDTPAEAEQMQMLIEGSDDNVALYQFVHAVISAYQRDISPEAQKIRNLAGNGDWVKVFEQIIEKKAAS